VWPAYSVSLTCSRPPQAGVLGLQRLSDPSRPLQAGVAGLQTLSAPLQTAIAKNREKSFDI